MNQENQQATSDSRGASPIQGPRSSEKKAKAKKRELSIEEVFASVSTVQASGLNPPPARTVLTPRSAEACLKHGINPEILRIRDLESFFDVTVDPAVQRMRHEAYSQRRHEMMALVRTERKKIVNAEVKAGMTSGETEGLTPGAIIAAQVSVCEGDDDVYVYVCVFSLLLVTAYLVFVDYFGGEIASNPVRLFDVFVETSLIPHELK